MAHWATGSGQEAGPSNSTSRKRPRNAILDGNLHKEEQESNGKSLEKDSSKKRKPWYRNSRSLERNKKERGIKNVVVRKVIDLQQQKLVKQKCFHHKNL